MSASAHPGLLQRAHPAHHRNTERRLREIECELGSRFRPQGEFAIARHDHHRELFARRNEFVGGFEIEVVSGSAIGERITGRGAPIEIQSEGTTLCVVARSFDGVGHQSIDAGPACAG